MIAWRRASEAGRPWATWGLLAATLAVQLGTGGTPEAQARLGLLPTDPRLAALLGHLFLHDGLAALLATLGFAAAAGPWLEGRLGRRVLVASYLAGGLAGAVWFAATAPDAEMPRLGASAAVAGWLGLLAVGARGAPVDLLGLAAGRAGSLLAPGWALAALWLGAQLAGLLIAPGGVGAAASGFGFGAVLALGLGRSGVWWRDVDAPSAAEDPPASRPAAPRRTPPGAAAPAPPGADLLAPAAATLSPAALEARLAASPDPAVARGYLAHAAAEGRGASARAVVAERLREALAASRREPALALWSALVGAGGAPVDASTDQLFQLASWARAATRPGEASAALHAALAGADAAGAARIARWARRAEPVVCFRAAERALEDPALGPSERSALEGLRVEAEREAIARGVILLPNGAAPAAPRSAPPAPTPAAPAAAAPRKLARGEPLELDAEAPPAAVPLALPDPERSGEAAFLDAFHAALQENAPKPDAPPLRALRVREAVPRALDADGLVLEVEGRGSLRLRLPRIHAVALAGVRGLSERGADKPVLLVDLCLSAEAEPELHVLRLRSDRFDPRRVAPAPESSPLAALRAFVAVLAAAAHAPVLPAADASGEAPLRIYRDLATYQREVLGAA